MEKRIKFWYSANSNHPAKILFEGDKPQIKTLTHLNPIATFS